MQPSNRAEEAYNRRHTTTRYVVERAFGVLKMRFWCVDRSAGYLAYAPTKCCSIITAVMVLHNICVRGNVPIPDMEGIYVEDDDDDGQNVFVQPATGPQDGIDARRRLVDTFTRQ